MTTKFFLCTTCGNVVVKVVDSGVIPVCCGKEMKELDPKTMDGAAEKHVPVVERVDDCTIKVKVGSLPHPMTAEHGIRFIYLETENGGQLQYLQTGGEAEALFCGCKDKPVAVYEYCNVHGLWRAEVKDCEMHGDKDCGDDDKCGSSTKTKKRGIFCCGKK